MSKSSNQVQVCFSLICANEVISEQQNNRNIPSLNVYSTVASCFFLECRKFGLLTYLNKVSSLKYLKHKKLPFYLLLLRFILFFLHISMRIIKIISSIKITPQVTIPTAMTSLLLLFLFLLLLFLFLLLLLWILVLLPKRTK